MHYAVIDLGSNSIRLSVYECDGKQIHTAFTDKALAGLAGYVSDDALDVEGIKKACHILNSFKDIAAKFAEPENISVFASASLRNVSNGNEAVDMITRETSLSPVILSGEEEASLGYVGVSNYLDCNDGIMIDIGGASTELVLFKNGRIENLTSLPIGCLNLYVKYVSEILPKKNERKRIKAKIEKHFSTVDWAQGETQPLMVGIGGTLRSALALSRTLFDLPEDGNEILPDHIATASKLLAKNKEKIYLKVYRTVPERLMTISTGLAILRCALKVFGCETISVSHFGVREGYLVDRVLNTGEKYVISHRFEDC